MVVSPELRLRLRVKTGTEEEFEPRLFAWLFSFPIEVEEVSFGTVVLWWRLRRKLLNEDKKLLGLRIEVLVAIEVFVGEFWVLLFIFA